MFEEFSFPFLGAEQVAHAVVGALGFSLGLGYSVELIRVMEEDGTSHIFGVSPPHEEGATLMFEP